MMYHWIWMLAMAVLLGREFNRIKWDLLQGNLSTCPGCGGDADNGHDRCLPPNVYYCIACQTKGNPE